MLQKKRVHGEQQKEKDHQKELLAENIMLRKQLIDLSHRVDQQLQSAAKLNLRQQKSPVLTSTSQSQQRQLENAYKQINRLQQSIKNYENKQALEPMMKRVQDLQIIIHERQVEIRQLKSSIKQSKQIIRSKGKQISQLLAHENSGDINQGKHRIAKLQYKIGKMSEQNELLRKKGNQKHAKCVEIQSKVCGGELQQERGIQVPQNQLKDLEQLKAKCREAMLTIQNNNAQISGLHVRYSQLRIPRSQRYQHSTKKVSKSMDELPSLPGNKIKPKAIEQMLPSPRIVAKLRRY